MSRLLRATAFAPLFAAGGTLVLLGVGIASLWCRDSARTSHEAESPESAAFATHLHQPIESASYPVELLEPRRLRLPAEVIPAAFVFGPPPLGNSDSAESTGKPASQNAAPPTAPNNQSNVLQAPVNGDPNAPDQSGAAPQLNSPVIAPPANSTEAAKLPSVMRRLPSVEEGDVSLEPRRLPPVDEASAADLNLQRLPEPTSDETETSVSSQLPALQEDFPAASAKSPPVKENRYIAEPSPKIWRLPSLPSKVFEPIPPADSASGRAGAHVRNDPTRPAQSDIAPLERPPAFDPAMAAVSRQSMEMVQYGFSLAHRGATYSARAQFVQALRSIAQALDAAEGSDLHSQSLAEGLRALEEADDFVPRGSQLEADMRLESIIASHRTTVLKGEPALSALEALQRYYTYAQNRLASAGGGMPAASMALYALGKLQTAEADPTPQNRRLNDPKALALHHAALLVDSRNYEAANELGVLLARYGQLQDARGVLLHGLSQRPTSAMWHNLSVVHERLGEVDLARRARNEQQLAERNSPSDPLASAVRWVSPAEFARTSQSGDPSLANPSAGTR